MLGCDGVKVYQFFYQSKEEYEMMINHQPKLFISPPSYDLVTIFEYNLGKHIPLQLIFDVYQQSKYFRLRVGQIMKIIELLLESLQYWSDNKMLNHDLDPKNIWIIFEDGEQLGPEFNDKIKFKIQIQGRWKSDNVDQYLDIIFKIIKQLASIMDKSIPNAQRGKGEVQIIEELQKQIYGLYATYTLNQMYQEIKKLQIQYQQEGCKLKLDIFDTSYKRKHRINDAQKDIQSLYKDLQSQKQDQNKYEHQYQFYNTYQHLIDFTKHFSQQLHNHFYSNYQYLNKQKNIDFNSFNVTLHKIQQTHPFQLGNLALISEKVILQSLALRGLLNYFNIQIDPSQIIITLLRDAFYFFLSETQNIQRHLTKYYNIDKNSQYDINENCRFQIELELQMILLQSDMERFINYKNKVEFQEKIFKQYSNHIHNKISELF